MEQSWSQRRYRGNLVDMHIPDWNEEFLSRFDAKTYVDMLERARVDAAYLYSSSCLGICYWPSAVGHQHAGIKGRDILGERIDECHRRGMDVIVYYNWWSLWAYEAHPDWRCVNARGEGTAEHLWTLGHYGVCCFNSPHADLVMTQVEELCTRYSFEGLWIDMIFWPYSVCFCSHCRRRYHDETGEQLPRKVNWQDPEWVRFQRTRERWLAEYVARITRTAKRLKPGVTVGHQCAAWSVGWTAGLSSDYFRASDYLSGDFYGGGAEQSFICKLFTHLTETRPFEFMTSRCPDLTDHTTMKSRALLEAQVYSAMAHQARFLFIDAIDPVGTLDPHVFDEMRAVYGKTMAYEPFLSPLAKPVLDVGVYFNTESLIEPRDNGKSVADVVAGKLPVVAAIANVSKTLAQGHVTHGVLTPKNLAELDSFQLLVVPELFMIGRAEVDALTRYVERGGSLYVSRSTSLLTTDGERQPDFLLSELCGVSYVGETAEEVTYMAPAAGQEALFAPYTGRHPLTIMGSQMLVNARPGAEVLATITRPYTDPRDPTRFSSAISNPPGIPTEHPALVLNRFGKGRVIYAAGCLERMEHDAHRVILRRLVDLLAARPFVVRTDAPSGVEVTVFDQEGERRLIVSLLSFQAELPGIPVHGVNVGVHAGGRRIAGAALLPAGTKLPFRMEKGYAEFEVDTLDAFQMVALNYTEGGR